MDARRSSGCAVSFCLLVAASSGAWAADALNSSDRPVNGDAPGPGDPTVAVPHDEFNVLPIAGGSTDIGIGGGYFSGFTHIKPGFDPYLWNIESAGLITFKPGDLGGVVVPYVDVFVKLTIPSLFGAPLRLEIRPSYTAERTVHYYGVGNASSNALPAGVSGYIASIVARIPSSTSICASSWSITSPGASGAGTSRTGWTWPRARRSPPTWPPAAAR